MTMRILSLYCGAGGIDEGLRQAGLRTTTAVDRHPDCCETMRLNHPDTEVIKGTIADLEGTFGRYDMVVGGPPCPEFSTANTKHTNDPTEVNRFWRIAKATGARHVIMENVRGVLNFLPPEAAPYNRYVVNAADYGVPQIRKRAIVTDLPRGQTSHSKQGGQATLFGSTLQKWVSIREALGLDGLLCDRSKRFNRNHHWPTNGPIVTLLANCKFIFRPSPDYIIQDRKHQDGVRDYSVDRPSCVIHTDARMWLLKDLKEDHPDWTEKHKPSNIEKPAYTVMGKDRGRVNNTITDNSHVRKLTERELATLQGFPTGYKFAGRKGSQTLMIGNALPPAVIKAFVAPLVMVKV